MFEEALVHLEKTDTFAAIEFLDQQPDPLEIAEVYQKLVSHLYWKEKNVPDMIAIARAGIQYALDKAAVSDDPERALALKSQAKAIAYNLASNTWIGWDEAGITLDPSDQEIGLDAAKTNLRLGLELDKGDLPISRAYWVLGAQLLAAGAYKGALGSFEQAEMYADRAMEKGDALLAVGYEAITRIVIKPENKNARLDLDRVKLALAEVEDGEFFIQQLDSALRVFTAG